MFTQAQIDNQVTECNELLGKLGYSDNDSIFITAICRASKKVKPVQFVTTYNQLQRRYNELRELNSDGFDIYFCPAKIKDGKSRRTAANFESQQMVFWLDMDPKNNDFNTMFGKLQERYFVPNMLVRTSPGSYHAYFILPELVPVEDIRRVMIHVGKELSLDHTHDVSRILRLPGFSHQQRKYGDEEAKKKATLVDDYANLVHQVTDDIGELIDINGITDMRSFNSLLENIKGSISVRPSATRTAQVLRADSAQSDNITVPVNRTVPPAVEAALEKIYATQQQKLQPKLNAGKISQSEVDWRFEIFAYSKYSKEDILLFLTNKRFGNKQGYDTWDALYITHYKGYDNNLVPYLENKK